MYEKCPSNISNYASENMDVFLSNLHSVGVPYVDFRETLDRSELKQEDYFFYTDHHWTPGSGLAATKGICEKLNRLYGFDYNKEYVDYKNYNITLLKKWFLGSYGKKVGCFFSWHGPDDFEVIIPSFETDMIEEDPLFGTRKGSFENTVLFKERLEKNYYTQNTYAAYSYANFHLQIMKNNLLHNGKKILLIRDSFACVVAPFLSLQTKELDICDMRDYVEGNRLNLKEYIAKTNPDYVIVLFSGVGNVHYSAGQYDFLT